MLMGQTTDSGELIQGTLEMLILKALLRGPLHGYSVAEWIQQTSKQMLKVEEGALYPALHRMELRGLLKSRWGTSDNNRRAKFYELTTVGQKKPLHSLRSNSPEYELAEHCSSKRAILAV